MPTPASRRPSGTAGGAAPRRGRAPCEGAGHARRQRHRAPPVRSHVRRSRTGGQASTAVQGGRAEAHAHQHAVNIDAGQRCHQRGRLRTCGGRWVRGSLLHHDSSACTRSVRTARVSPPAGFCVGTRPRFGGGYFLQPDHFYMAIATNRFRLATEADVTAGTAPAVGAPVSTRCSATDFMDAWRRTIRRIDDLCRSTPPPESALRHRKPKA